MGARREAGGALQLTMFIPSDSRILFGIAG